MKNGLHIDRDGTKRYYLNNEFHRLDGPAVVWSDGSKIWYFNGHLHRDDDPASELSNGDKFWYVHGKQHRIDGPAEEWATGSKVWLLNDEKHRLDGPAVEWANGAKYWYFHGKPLIHSERFNTMEEFFNELNNNEEYSLQYISDFNGLIEFIKNPTGKQKRLHAMRWKI